jgi:hypothetical protein
VHKLITQNDIIDSILNSHKNDLGKYFEQYKNHVYRVYNLAVAHVTSDRDIKILSIAGAYHDLGIWTSNTFDYLKPSVELAEKYCIENSIDNRAASEIEIIIDDHHKLSKTKRSKLAEIFRKADLIDLTFGLMGNPINRKLIRDLREVFPNKGFHITLCRLFIKNLFKNPFRPLPMYKW